MKSSVDGSKSRDVKCAKKLDLFRNIIKIKLLAVSSKHDDGKHGAEV